MTANLVVRALETLLVLCENDKTPSDKEWDGFLAMLPQNSEHYQKLRILVLTTGGGPDRTQRERLDKTLAGRPIRVAVVSDSAKVRFIASAIALINRDHRGFSTKELSLAYDHLNLSTSERKIADRTGADLMPLVLSELRSR
jgi:hypothetical protein